MFIKEFMIHLYGPLRDRRGTLSPGFNLLLGQNEAGKTLTIDALVKLLLGRQAREKEFERLQRVEGQPAGFVIIENGLGETVKLPEQGDLTALTGLTPDECANIFVIRNSNLAIVRESEFYTSVTDRLTGLRTDEIAKIANKLYDIARLTPTGQFRNAGDDKLKSRLEEARAAADQIENLHARLLKDGFDELEKEQVDCLEELNAVTAQLEALEQARQREKYEKGRRALEQLRQANRQLAATRHFTAAGERLWADSERELSRLEQEEEGLLAALKDKEDELCEINRLLQERQRKFRQLDERKQTLDEDIRPALKNYTARKEAWVRREEQSRFYSAAAVAAAVILALSTLGALLNPGPFFYVLAALTAAAAAFSWLALNRRARERGDLAVTLEQLKTTLARLGLNSEDEASVHRVVQLAAEEYTGEYAALESLKADASVLTREVTTLRDSALPACLIKRRKAAAALSEIKREAGCETLRQYTIRLHEKHEAEQAVSGRSGILESLFGSSAAGLEKSVAAWTISLEELAPYAEASPDINADDRAAAALKVQRQALKERKADVEVQMEHAAQELRQIERQVNQALQSTEDYLYCQTTADLLAVKAKLTAFVQEHHRLQEDALQVISIFEAIAGEEKARVAELFGAASPISAHFREITAGLYESVSYDGGRGLITVQRRDGANLIADKLSGGAYDQLYLSIRLALAEKLLKGEPGFLIMDDPFIKSDDARLRRQLQTLLQIAAAGWQILYFSAKEEVREALAQDISKGEVNQIETRESGPGTEYTK